MKTRRFMSILLVMAMFFPAIKVFAASVYVYDCYQYLRGEVAYNLIPGTLDADYSNPSRVIYDDVTISGGTKIKCTLQSLLGTAAGYTSNDSSIAKIVSTDGNSVIIEGVNTGTTKIGLYMNCDGRYIPTSFNVTVEKTITISNPSLYIGKDKSEQINASINSTDGSITWKSLDTSVATVTSTGLVKGVSPGTTKICLTPSNGGTIKYCDVTVYETGIASAEFTYIGTGTSNEIYITGVKDTSIYGKLIIPEYIDGKKVVGFYNLDYEKPFLSLPKITSIELPDTFKTSRSYEGIFANMTSIKHIKLPKTWTEIPMRIFQGCESLQSVEFSENITRIGIEAFAGCKSLKSIELPDTVTSIGTYAFSGCDSLSEVDLSNTRLKILSYGIFSGCDSLESIALPEGLETVGERAFSSTALTELNIPDSVKELCYYFIGNTNIKEITLPSSLGIPAGYSSYKLPFVFGNCYNLEKIHIENNPTFSTDSYGVLYNADKTELLYYPQGRSITEYTIPDGVTSIGSDAFGVDNGEGEHYLQTVTIPKTLETVESWAFSTTDKLSKVIYKGSESQFSNMNINAKGNTLLTNATREYLEASVDGVSLDKTEVTLTVGESDTLTATVTPDNAGNKNVTWETSDASVATVADGVITACAEGITTITATTEDGGYQATCNVTVNPRQAVAAPTAGISSGKVVKGTKVALATQTDGALIYYTLDGSTPDANSSLYTGEISITEDVAIKAIAIKDGMDNSPVATFVYTTVAENATAITVSNASGNVGDTVSVTIDISNNPGIAGAILKLAHAEELILTNIEVGEALNTLTFTPPANLSKNPCTLLWDGIDGDSSNGTLLTLTFTISETAELGDYAITLSYTAGDIYDGSLNDIDVVINNGKISVVDFMIGDVNDDKVINAKDLTILRRYISGDYDVTANEKASDVNKDTLINAKDITILRRFISGDYGIVLE